MFKRIALLYLIGGNSHFVCNMELRIQDPCSEANINAQDLKQKRATQKEFKNQLHNLNGDARITQFNRISTHFESRDAGFLLDECGTQCCLLNRLINPGYREVYANKVTKKALKCINKNQENLHYVSFGCGALFQDSLILTSILKQVPRLTADIHLIDPYYTLFTDTMNSAMAKNKNLIEPLELNESDIESFLWLQGRYNHFINTIKRKAPAATLLFILHSNAQAYKKYVKKNNNSYADITTAADIEDSFEKSSVGALYIDLCIKALKHNPYAKNIWLTRCNNYYEYDDKIHLLSLFLKDKPAQNNPLLNFKKNEKSSVAIYTQDTVI